MKHPSSKVIEEIPPMEVSQTASLRLVVTGGGTGGHLYPALAVAQAFREHPATQALLYIGNANRREATLIPEHGIPFAGIVFAGMPRNNPVRLLPWSLSLLWAFRESRRILAAFRPTVLFATGGYVTAPVVLAARSLHIPYILHEPDAYPGLVNRTLACGAACVTVAFSGATSRLKNRHIHVTGNPLRLGMAGMDKATARDRLALAFDLNKPVILVTGGSQGARRLNQAVLDALPALVNDMGVQVLHQTGDTLFEETIRQCPEAFKTHPAYAPCPFIGDMGAALALADIAVCRSGSMTLSEMYQAGIPTILVPYPYAAADHQRANALASQQAGASLMIEDGTLTGAILMKTLQPLINETDQLANMQAAALKLAHPNATMVICQAVLEQMPASTTIEG
jgi:UDP-N-acetylglucosamine--N-acetylmuramyl-(pentapeptide) pyrophosphoryl-undecaprenol N-acetylglucosamine transferase